MSALVLDHLRVVQDQKETAGPVLLKERLQHLGGGRFCQLSGQRGPACFRRESSYQQGHHLQRGFFPQIDEEDALKACAVEPGSVRGQHAFAHASDPVECEDSAL